MPCCPSARHKKQEPEDRFLVRLHPWFEWVNQTEKNICPLFFYSSLSQNYTPPLSFAKTQIKRRSWTQTILSCDWRRSGKETWLNFYCYHGNYEVMPCTNWYQLTIRFHFYNKLLNFSVNVPTVAQTGRSFITTHWLLLRCNFAVFISWVAIELSQLSFKNANWAHSWFSKFEPQSLRTYQRPQVILNHHMPPKKSY